MLVFCDVYLFCSDWFTPAILSNITTSILQLSHKQQMTSQQLTKYVDSTATQVKDFLNQVATRMESSLHHTLNVFEEKLRTFEEKLSTFEEKLSTFEGKLSTFEEKLVVIEAAASSSVIKNDELEDALLAMNTSLHGYMVSDK